ncbi:MAG: hypothetical protein RR500_06730 [Bacilli bacterium]
MDYNNEDYNTSFAIYINKNNKQTLEKLSSKNYFDYTDYYAYNFLFKGNVFYHRIYICELVNNKKLSNLINKEILDYYNKIKNKEYISPQKAVRIAKANGLKNICYQSLTSASFYNRNQNVWQIQDCSSEKKAKVIELNPRSGKVLNMYDKNYEKVEKAAYWSFFNSKKIVKN